MRDEEKPAPVSETKHVGEAQARWDWVERSVWTDRMLKALATGGKTTWERRFPRAEAVLLHCSPPLGHSILFEVNHQPESPVREIRTPGSEGGAADQPPSLPLAMAATFRRSIGEPRIQADGGVERPFCPRRGRRFRRAAKPWMASSPGLEVRRLSKASTLLWMGQIGGCSAGCQPAGGSWVEEAVRVFGYESGPYTSEPN